MTRNRKVQLAAMAVLVVLLGTAALVVTAAGAHTPAKFEFPKGGNTKIDSKVDGNHEIDIPGYGKLVCKRADFEATVTGTSSTSITLDPFFAECTLNGVKANVLAQSCQFVIKADGGMTIASRAGEKCNDNPFEIKDDNGCEVTIGEQNLTGIGYTNINKNEEITFSMTITKIQGFRFGCAPEGEFTAGQYTTGNSTLTGAEDPGPNKKPIKWVATVP